MKRHAGIAFLFIFLSIGINAQTDWDTYPSRGIYALIEQEQKLVSQTPKTDMVISAQPFPSKTVVTYTGTKRPIDDLGKLFIKLWTQSRGVPPENADMLAEEVLFKERDKSYWIPVLRTLMPALEKELQSGDEIEIYFFYLGGFNPKSLLDKDKTRAKSPINNEEDAIRWIFAVEEFQKVPPSPFISQNLEKAIDGGMEVPGKIKDVWFDPRQIKSKTRLVFTAEVRSVSAARRRLVDLWFEKNGFPPDTSSLMAKEARFMDGDKEYWIVMRNKTLEDIVKSVKKGGSVFLNTILAGGVRNGDNIDWLFLSGEHSL